MQKIDKTTYRHSDTERIPEVLEYKSAASRISYTVHRHIYEPDTWFLSSKEFCDMVDLNTDDLAEAEKKAADHIIKLAKKKIQELTAFVEDIKKSFEVEEDE